MIINKFNIRVILIFILVIILGNQMLGKDHISLIRQDRTWVYQEYLWFTPDNVVEEVIKNYYYHFEDSVKQNGRNYYPLILTKTEVIQTYKDPNLDSTIEIEERNETVGLMREENGKIYAVSNLPEWEYLDEYQVYEFSTGYKLMTYVDDLRFDYPYNYQWVVDSVSIDGEECSVFRIGECNNWDNRESEDLSLDHLGDYNDFIEGIGFLYTGDLMHHEYTLPTGIFDNRDYPGAFSSLIAIYNNSGKKIYPLDHVGVEENKPDDFEIKDIDIDIDNQTINFINPYKVKFKLAFIRCDGQVLFEKECFESYTLRCDGLSNGLYLITVTTGTGTKCYKVLL